MKTEVFKTAQGFKETEESPGKVSSILNLCSEVKKECPKVFGNQIDSYGTREQPVRMFGSLNEIEKSVDGARVEKEEILKDIEEKSEE